MREMFFGTRERFTSVACPAINVGTSSVGWSNSGTFENGGGFVDESTGSHKEYDMSWNLLDAVSARVISDYAEKVYGSGPIYFYLPGTLDQNVFPADVAAPGRAVDGGASLVKGVRPAAVATPANNANLPVRSASYTLTSGSVAREIYLPVPSGYTLHLSGYGSATGTAKIAGDAPLNTVATNLITNPSGRNTSGTVEVMRNLVSNPSFEVNTAGWISAGGTALSTDAYQGQMWDWMGGRSGTRIVQVTADGSSAYLTIAQDAASRFAVTPGTWVGISVLLASDIPAPGGVRSDVVFRGSATTYHAEGPFIPSGWYAGRRATYAVQVPAGSTSAEVRVQGYSGSSTLLPSGRRIWADSVIAVQADSEAAALAGVATYFDGANSPDPDLTPSWTGTPNASESVLTAPKPVGWVAVRGLVYYSTTRDRLAFRVDSDGGLTYAYTAVGNQQGKTITALAEVELTPPGAPLNVAAYKYGTGLTYTPVTDKALVRHAEIDPRTNPNVVFGVRPADAPTYGGTIYFRMAAVEGEYTDTYFDGSQPPALAKNYATNSAPSNAGDFSYQAGIGEVSGSTLVTDASDGPLPDVNSYVRRTITAPKSASGSGFFSYNRAPAPASMGTTWNAAVWFRPSVPIRMRMTVSGRTSISGAVGGASSADAVELPANVWTRVVGAPLTLTEAAQAIGWWAVIDNASIIPAGGTIDVAAPMVVSGSEVPPFFSGASPDGMWLGAANASASIRYDTAYRTAWSGAANASTSLLQTGGNRVLTLDGRPQAFEGPTGVTFKASGVGNLTLSGLMARLLPNDDSPVNVGWISGQGHSGVRFANRPQTSTYSAVLDKYSVSAKFVEVGLWE